MIKESSSLYSTYCDGLKRSQESFLRSIATFLQEGTSLSPSLFEEEKIDVHAFEKLSERIAKWKRLLTYSLFFTLSKRERSDLNADKTTFFKEVGEGATTTEKVLIALNDFFLNKKGTPITVPTLGSGALLFQLNEEASWLMRPCQSQQVELSILVALLAILTESKELVACSLQLNDWLLKTLDERGIPLRGLFLTEKESQRKQQLFLTYLCFRAGAIAAKNSLFQTLSEALLQELKKEEKSNNEEEIEPLWLLLDAFLNDYPPPSPSHSLELDQTFQDSSTAFVGFRYSDYSLFCTLHGGGSGLGVIKNKNVEIVAYGPHYLPLADCRGFGIIGSALSDQGMRRSIIETGREKFFLKGCVRLIDPFYGYPSESRLTYEGIWMDVVQEFHYPRFSLKSSFFSLHQPKEIVLSFFIRAAMCEVEDERILYPKTLQNYDGKTKSLLLKDENGDGMKLTNDHPQDRLQVIPLSGEGSFWGGDFLIAYFLDFKETTYRWTIDFIRQNSL